jgi:hypothetical protein
VIARLVASFAAGNVRGWHRYVSQGHKALDAWMTRPLARADDPIREMRSLATLASPKRRPVLHVVLSYAPDEAPGLVAARADWDRLLERLGCATGLAIAYPHGDGNCRHVHGAIVDSDIVTGAQIVQRTGLHRDLLDFARERTQYHALTTDRPLPARMQDGEVHNGFASFGRFLRNTLAGAESWAEVDRRCDSVGVRREARRNGGVFVDATGPKVFAVRMSAALDPDHRRTLGPAPAFRPYFARLAHAYGELERDGALGLAPSLGPAAERIAADWRARRERGERVGRLGRFARTIMEKGAGESANYANNARTNANIHEFEEGPTMKLTGEEILARLHKDPLRSKSGEELPVDPLLMRFLRDLKDPIVLPDSWRPTEVTVARLKSQARDAVVRETTRATPRKVSAQTILNAYAGPAAQTAGLALSAETIAFLESDPERKIRIGKSGLIVERDSVAAIERAERIEARAKASLERFPTLAAELLAAVDTRPTWATVHAVLAKHELLFGPYYGERTEADRTERYRGGGFYSRDPETNEVAYEIVPSDLDDALGINNIEERLIGPLVARSHPHADLTIAERRGLDPQGDGLTQTERERFQAAYDAHIGRERVTRTRREREGGVKGNGATSERTRRRNAEPAAVKNAVPPIAKTLDATAGRERALDPVGIAEIADGIGREYEQRGESRPPWVRDVVAAFTNELAATPMRFRVDAAGELVDVETQLVAVARELPRIVAERARVAGDPRRTEVETPLSAVSDRELARSQNSVGNGSGRELANSLGDERPDVLDLVERAKKAYADHLRMYEPDHARRAEHLLFLNTARRSTDRELDDIRDNPEVEQSRTNELAMLHRVAWIQEELAVTCALAPLPAPQTTFRAFVDDSTVFNTAERASVTAYIDEHPETLDAPRNFRYDRALAAVLKTDVEEDIDGTRYLDIAEAGRLRFEEREERYHLARNPREDDLDAALLLAQARFGIVDIEGDARFVTRALRRSLELGIPVSGDQHLEQLAQLRAEMHDREALNPDGTVRDVDRLPDWAVHVQQQRLEGALKLDQDVIAHTVLTSAFGTQVRSGGRRVVTMERRDATIDGHEVGRIDLYGGATALVVSEDGLLATVQGAEQDANTPIYRSADKLRGTEVSLIDGPTLELFRGRLGVIDREREQERERGERERGERERGEREREPAASGGRT